MTFSSWSFSQAAATLSLSFSCLFTWFSDWWVPGPCESDDDDCYFVSKYISSYLNQEYVQKASGSRVSKFEGCSSKVGQNFAFNGDGSRPFNQYVAQILEKGIPVCPSKNGMKSIHHMNDQLDLSYSFYVF